MPLPTLKTLKDKGLKKPTVREPTVKTSRGRTPKREEPDIEEEIYEEEVYDVAADENDRDERKKLLDILLTENEHIDIDELIRSEVLEMGGKGSGRKGTTAASSTKRTGQPLKRVREGMEDVFTTLQLRELIDDFRKEKKDRRGEVKQDSGNNMAMMMPFLQKMQNGGVNVGGLDPNLLYLLMGNQGNKGGNNLDQLMMMMMMMQGEQGNPKQQASNMALLMKEVKNMMGQKNTKPLIDPSIMMMMQMMNKQSSQQSNQLTVKDIAALVGALNPRQQQNSDAGNSSMAMVMEMMRQNWALQNERVMGMMPSEGTEDKIMKNFKLFRELQGDNRQRTKDELEYDLKIQELSGKRQDRMDMLDREERSMEREDAKSDRTLSLVNTVADKVIGNGLGALVGDLVAARGNKGKKSQGDDEEMEEFDASILDDF